MRSKVGRARETTVLLLVVFAACAFVYPYGDQDASRLALTRAIGSYGTLRIDRWQSSTGDKSHYRGHWYSDKAPGMSFLALPAYEIVHGTGEWQRRWTLWLMRVTTGGLAFAAMLILVQRGAEGFAPGSGLMTAVAAGAGTFAFSLAATMFSHIAAGALGLLAFLLLIHARGHPDGDRATAAAGLAVGTAVFFDYLAALIVFVLGAYVLLTTRSPRRFALYVAGGLPAAAALAVYDQFAFGAPWRLSYRYVVGFYGREQSHGIFGSGIPRLGYLERMLTSERGLFLSAPILIVGVLGLLLLWRERRGAEEGACLAIVALFFVYSAGYFDPIGGTSPGPRFLGAAVPFAALGLAPLARRRPRLTAVLVACSIAAAIADAVSWAWVGNVTWLFVNTRPVVAGAATAVLLFAAFASAAIAAQPAER